MPLKAFTSKHFLGRTRELEVLQRIASEAGSGNAGSVLLLGRRGIGKTELLRHLFNRLFNDQGDTVPFFYTVKTAFTSLENFSRDYLSSFILQGLAFLKKDPSLVNTGIYSLEDLRDIANKSEAQWAVNIIDDYMQIEEGRDISRLFSFAISAPYHAYLKTGKPALVIIDDFHKIKKLCELNADECGRDIWMLIENPVKFRHTPHILAGFQAELHSMFFEETGLGEQLETIILKGLNTHDSAELFASLCGGYALGFEAELTKYLDLFNGNPFYIKSFVQAARQSVGTLTENDFWDIYVTELTRGKLFTYWTSLLKSYIPSFELRKPSLNFLYRLTGSSIDDIFANVSEMLSIQREELDQIIGLLNRSGTIEIGFSTLELTDDEIFIDIIKGLYHREIQKTPPDSIKDLIIEDKRAHEKLAEKPSFDITIPAAPKAEIVAVKSLEQIAQHFNIPPEITGQLQVALVELFTGVLPKDESSAGKYQLKFVLRDNKFNIEVLTSQSGLVLTGDNSRQIKPYVDEIRVDQIMNGSKITLTRELKEDLTPAS